LGGVDNIDFSEIKTMLVALGPLGSLGAFF
jgi:hypothetical protein